MSALFISHSSKDRTTAERLASQLRQRRFESFFLDFDPEKGIPVGKNWAKVLYRKLLRCSAVVFLCTRDAVKSKWCFAELAQARALGKQILPVRIDGHALPGILREVQAIDVSARGDFDEQQLWRELERIGLSEDAGFAWDESLAPYPGISAFAERDAAVFFGRKTEIGQLVDLLGRMRLADTRLALLVGGSGSGKSSLVGAGIMPRLRRNRDDWIVLGQTIAGPGLIGRLAEELAAVIPQGRDRPAYDTVYAEIRKAAAGKGDLSRSAFSSRLRNLRLGAGTRNAQVLWIVDQAERLLSNEDECARARRFLERCARSSGLPLQVVCTLRSDHLDAFRSAVSLDGIGVEIFSLGPLPTSRFGEVIEGPARLSGLDLAPGLVAAMAGDASRPDGLPLLAFALRELWDRFGRSSQKITLENYIEDLGRLEGCVARRATETVSRLRLSSEQSSLLRETVSRMARIGEAETYVGQPIDWASVPEQAKPALQSLVDARLLVTGREGGTIEVAHDVLFRAWDQLREWLDAKRKFLEWRRGLESQVQAWEGHGHDIEQIQLTGALLKEAQGWLESHRVSLDEAARRFVEASIERAAHEDARWRNAYQTSLARQLAAQANVILGLESAELLDRGLLLAVESMRRCVEFGIPRFEADQALRQGLAVAARQALTFKTSEQIHFDAVAIDPRRSAIVVGQQNGQTSLLRLGMRQAEVGPTLGSAVQVIEFSPDGEWFVVGDEAGECKIVNVASGEVKCLEPPFERRPVRAVCFSANAKFLAVAFHTRLIVWPVPALADPVVIEHDGDMPIVSMTFSGDATVLVTQEAMSDTICWRWERKEIVMRVPTRGNHVAHSPDGRFLAVSSASTYKALLFDTFSGEWHELANNCARMAFSADGAFLGMASPEHFARIWRLPDLSVVQTLRHNAEVWNIAFSPDGCHVVTSAKNNVAHVWDTTSGAETARMVLPEPLGSVRFLPDSRHVLTHSGSGTVILWDTVELCEIRLLRHKVAVLGVAFGAETRLLATRARASQFDRVGTLIDIVERQPVQSLKLQDGREVNGTEHAGQLLAAHEERTRKEARSKDGRVVARAEGAVVNVFRDGAEETRLWTLRHERAVLHLVFSNDGCYLATVSDHDTARVWDVGNGSEVSRLSHDRPNVTDVDWSPDDRYLATASWDCTARVWLWRPEDLISAASTRLARNLSREEWERYLPGEPYRQTIPEVTESRPDVRTPAGVDRERAGDPSS